MKRYDGQVAVVTGASSGLGRRMAIDLARRGATVVGIARRVELLEELRGQGVSDVVACDVSYTDRFAATLADIERGRGRVDVLINSAGIEDLTPAEGGRLEEYRRIMETNFFGALTGTLAVLPGMLDRGSGVVVNVSSDTGRAPQAGVAAYAGSKAAISAVTDALGQEVKDRGVHLHVLYPGWVPTPMGQGAIDRGMPMPPKSVRRTEEQVSDLVLDGMGGPAIELNAAKVAALAPLARTFAPSLYRKAMASRANPPH